MNGQYYRSLDRTLIHFIIQSGNNNCVQARRQVKANIILVCGENKMKLFFFIESYTFIVLCEMLMPCHFFFLLRNAQIVKK